MSNQLKIISFLGFTKYRHTTYLHPKYEKNQSSCETEFIQEALVEFYDPGILYVLLTNKVENEIPQGKDKTNWRSLQDKLANKQIKIEPIKNIPETGSPENIWYIFNQITECLEDGDRIIFDITNGFRSLPVVALLAISYLKVVKNVKIEGLVYGAFDPKNNQTPIYDLLPIIGLLDWITATDKFIKTGNGQELSGLIKESDRDNLDNLSLAQNINNIAQGLHLLRPINVMEEAVKLPDNIAKVAPTVSQSIPPFATLLQRVEADYGKYGLIAPAEFKTNGKEALSKMLAMAEWYKEKEQYVQALSLAREWLPSLLCWHFGLNVLDKGDRDEMELLLLGGTLKDRQTKEVLRVGIYLDRWQQEITEAKRKQLNKIWTGNNSITNLRNDVLHSGFRKNSRDTKEIIKQIDFTFSQLRDIANSWNI